MGDLPAVLTMIYDHYMGFHPNLQEHKKAKSTNHWLKERTELWHPRTYLAVLFVFLAWLPWMF